MENSFAQIRLAATIDRSGLTDAQLAEILNVNQSTVSRLRHQLIKKVAKYQKGLDAHLGRSTDADGDEISDLMSMATLSPALRDTLMAIERLMRENA
jgi:transcriptional regulator with XRE-family HTH domain